jgi:Fe-S-cluster containining protein
MFPAFFEQPIFVEENATCNDCAMCLKPGEIQVPGIDYFKPDVKCCSYYPKLSNYLVGGLLTDTNPALDEGRRRVRELIQRRVSVTPQAVGSPKRYSLLYKHATPRSFGRTNSLICPYYVKDGGLCSIWKFRDSVCSTYFCKTMAGKEGQKFWNILRAYLKQAQETLSWYALYKMNWDVEIIWDYLQVSESASLESEDLDEVAPPEESYARIWQDWVGKEEEFYRECFKIVSQVRPEEFEQISGMTEKVILRWLKEQHSNVIHPKIPPVLRKNPEMKSFPIADGSTYGIKTDTGYFTIRKALFDVIDWFDGFKTIEEIKQMVRDEYQDELNDDLLLPMFFNRILIPA